MDFLLSVQLHFTIDLSKIFLKWRGLGYAFPVQTSEGVNSERNSESFFTGLLKIE